MPSRDNAFTLLEVVAAVALLATLLVAVLTAHDRLARQTRRAEVRLLAIEGADQLLAAWTATSPTVIPAASGQLSTAPPLHWQVTPVSSPDLHPYGIQIAQLRVFDERSLGEAPAIPLATVEFLTTAAIPRP